MAAIFPKIVHHTQEARDRAVAEREKRRAERKNKPKVTKPPALPK